jgi:nitrite reductase (NO-forming)
VLVPALAIAVAFVAGACGGGSGTATTNPSGGLKVGMVDNSFQPEDVTYSGGTITFENGGAALHNFSVQGHGDIDVDVTAGGSKTIGSLTLAPGTYTFYCKYHKALGMTGTLTVT